jgi:tryprostatin B 6-hydroxylase
MWSHPPTDDAIDEDNYERASDFVPERWYSQPDMIKRKNAFAPFSLGPEGCIGKNCGLNSHI